MRIMRNKTLRPDGCIVLFGSLYGNMAQIEWGWRLVDIVVLDATAVCTRRSAKSYPPNVLSRFSALFASARVNSAAGISRPIRTA